MVDSLKAWENKHQRFPWIYLVMVKRLAGQMYAAFDGDTVRFVESMAHILYSVVKALNDSNRVF